MAEEELEYESDPEEAALSLAMRRRVASDDEEGDGRSMPRIEIASDAESDCQGGPDIYDDDDEQSQREEEEKSEEKASDNAALVGPESHRSGEQQEENAPFAVPTAGAFYMHDDRAAAAAATNRRTPGGRKLWESKDDRKWGHDKFEEMNVQEKQYDKEGRNSKGQYRGRGKTRGLDQRHARGNRPSAYDDKNTQNQTVRTVRGRGPRRYEPPIKNNRDKSTQNQQTGKSHESTSTTNSRRVSTNTRTPNVQSDSAPPRKHVFASSLNSASPPFYPSGSSNQAISQTQKKELPVGNTNKNLRPSILSQKKVSTSHSMALHRGKNVADVTDNVYIDEDQTFYGQFNNLQVQSSGPLPVITFQSPQMESIESSPAIPEQTCYHSSRGSQQAQVSVHQSPVRNPAQPSFRASSQQLGQHPSSVSQASSPPKALPTTSSEHGEVESPLGSSKSKTALVGKGKASVQGNGRGSFLYNGAQVMGASGSMGISHGDPNFPGTPALLQVMQFGGQHPGDVGVPAVGMALPGYVAQPGFGNSEMTWVPVLAGAAGALGGSYCPPYLAVDGGYYSRPTGQTSSSGASSKETSIGKPTNILKPAERSELVNDEFGQRQNKPRRYSEMNFGQ